MKSRSNLLAVLSVLALTAGTVRAEEASDVFLEIDAMPGHHTTSNVGDTDTSAMIEVLAFSDGLTRPASVDPRRAGKVVAQEITFKQRVGPSTPLFFDAAKRNSTVPAATFHFFGPDIYDGNALEFYKVTLMDVRVTSVKTVYEKGVGLVQEIKLVAHRIQWSYLGGGGQTEAEWISYERY